MGTRNKVLRKEIKFFQKYTFLPSAICPAKILTSSYKDRGPEGNIKDLEVLSCWQFCQQGNDRVNQLGEDRFEELRAGKADWVLMRQVEE